MSVLQRIKDFEMNIRMLVEHSVNIRKSLEEISKSLAIANKIAGFVAPTAPVTIEIEAAKKVVDEISNIVDNNHANK